MSSPDRTPEFVRLDGEVRRLHHLLRLVADAAGDAEAVTPAERAVLEAVEEASLPVPAIARARQVARQHVQVLVNALAEQGLVALKDNPAHKRSPLVGITAPGRRRLAALRKRQHGAVDKLALPVSAAELGRAADTLRALSEALASLLPRGRKAR